MYTVELLASKKAPQKKPYLARLSPAGREWGERLKASGTMKAHVIREALPGDIFECRGGLWDGDQGCYIGGTYWFTLGPAGEIARLERDEALTRAARPRIEGDVEAVTLPLATATYAALPDQLVRAVKEC